MSDASGCTAPRSWRQRRRRVGFTIVGLFADACGAVFEPTVSASTWVIGQSAKRDARP